MSQHRHTNEAIINAYKETGSVWRAGKKLGMSGQAVHKKLNALGYKLSNSKWTDDELVELAALMDSGVRLGEIADRLGRTYAAVAVKASRTGSRSTAPRDRKIPRGAGYDKASTLKNMGWLEAAEIPVTRFARNHSLEINTLVAAFQKHCPERWDRYVRTHSAIPERQCTYCGATFIPANGKQRFCGRQCQSTARHDAAYFGGKRRDTVGLAEGTCQLCGRRDVPGLSSHHVFGKENDAENDVLLALCRGCHKVITILGARDFVDDPTSWESLISLAWMRKHGPRYGDGSLDGMMLHVTVEIDAFPAEEGDEE